MEGATGNADREWAAFKERFGKSYGPSEDAQRAALFFETLGEIRRWNAERAPGDAVLGVMRWADWTDEERRRRLASYEGDPGFAALEARTDGAVAAVMGRDRSGLGAAALDYRCNATNAFGVAAVTPVKDQAPCGASWAYSSNAVAEGVTAIASGGEKLLDLSVQQIIDCNLSGFGCESGAISAGVRYFVNFGLQLTADYPTSADAAAPLCASDPSLTAASGSTIVALSGQESALMNVLDRYGPIAAAVSADCAAFLYYKEGVLSSGCDAAACEALDHAVTIVGYGTDAETEQPFWLVKNSWGEAWGEGGFARVLRDGDGAGVSGILCENVGLASAALLRDVQTTYSAAYMNGKNGGCAAPLPHAAAPEDDSLLARLMRHKLLLGGAVAAVLVAAALLLRAVGRRRRRERMRAQIDDLYDTERMAHASEPLLAFEQLPSAMPSAEGGGGAARTLP